jgi:hypothetical protein
MKIKYDRPTQYCPIRSELEERNFILVGRLVALIERLLGLTGRDHEAFVDTKAQCRTLHTGIVGARRDVQEHRLAHGC